MPKLRKPILWILLLGMLGFSACRTRKSAERRDRVVEPVVLTSPAPVIPVSVEPPIASVVPPVTPPEEPPPRPAIVQPLKVASVLSDNMVLQQGTIVPVWGWASDGETVTVTFRDQKVSARTRHGKWLVKLRDLKPGGPDVLTISASSQIELTNVLVGEVWICSGQSNMDWPLSKAFAAEGDIASATNSMIRLCTVPKIKSDTPLQDVKFDDMNGWREAKTQTVPTFSAVAYYFGRELHKARGVPIGLIQTSWGGSPAEAWTARPVLESNSRYAKEIIEKYAADQAVYLQALAEFEEKQAELIRIKSPKKIMVPRAPWKPSELYNGMVAPLIPYAIRGVIWYQGESNATRAHQYRSLFPHMIRNWRHDWQQGDFPFLCVQLAPFKPIQPQPVESEWAELREAQLMATKILPQVGMAVITDVGEERDIHPTKKAPVGERLSLAARALAYNEPLTYSGPIYRKMVINEDRILLHFDHVGSGLEVRGSNLKGFSICGEDRKFYWGIAEILPGNIISVRSPNVPNPVAVRLGWADYPVVNLWNKEGLPASPFRTDSFPMITAPKN
jgi:sialate O-acetylesterase